MLNLECECLAFLLSSRSLVVVKDKEFLANFDWWIGVSRLTRLLWKRYHNIIRKVEEGGDQCSEEDTLGEFFAW